ncbi:MAG: alpha/beta hydrolase [Eubacteriales bacterium]|nr:alpha/beta hydrolase [Eubacteriales bacterium]
MEKLNIWGEKIPGNSNQKKVSVMELRKNIKPSVKLDTIRWILTLKDGTFKKNSKKTIDTYVDRWVKKQDSDYQDTFTDVPYLIPFIAKGSKKAVIVVPGGGYCVKSMDGEGVDIAKELQKNGITAFVLWYRSCPYYQPYPLMDMQRAVRYVRFHAKDYGYDPKQIGAIGFSAGGAQVSLFMNVLRQGLITLPDYKKDEVDMTADSIQFAGLIYPALKYQYNINMLYASFPADEVRDEKKREEYRQIYDAVSHMNSVGIPHFICYGTKDTMVSLQDIGEYVKVLKDTSTPHKEVVVEGAGHGFGAAGGTEYGFWLNEYIKWAKAL